jgi:enamine deaminase RidA (YjgF/YER057c/UK114 family)
MLRRHGKTPILHNVVEHHGVLYLSGIVADDKSAPMKIQTEQTLTKIDALLTAHGSHKSKVLSATVFVTDLTLRPEMNEAWTAFFGDDLPARATVGVADLGKGVLIEVMVVAIAVA